MMVKKIKFRRGFLKHANYKNGYHVYEGMETVADSKEPGMPDSIIKLLYRIYDELENREEE